MAQVQGRGLISSVDLYTTNTQPSGAYLGQRVVAGDKEFVYVKAGASDLVLANLLQAPAIDAQFDDMATPTSYAAGYNAVGLGVAITNGTTTVTAGGFQGGTLTTSAGEEFTILDNTAGGSGATLTFYLDRVIRTAWTAASTTVTLRNIYNGVIQAPTTLTGLVVGVAMNAITTVQYGWIQTKGIAAVLSDNTTGAVGSALSNSGATAGDVGVFVAGTGRSFVGHTTRALSSAKYMSAKLLID